MTIPMTMTILQILKMKNLHHHLQNPNQKVIVKNLLDPKEQKIKLPGKKHLIHLDRLPLTFSACKRIPLDLPILYRPYNLQTLTHSFHNQLLHNSEIHLETLERSLRQVSLQVKGITRLEIPFNHNSVHNFNQY